MHYYENEYTLFYVLINITRIIHAYALCLFFFSDLDTTTYYSIQCIHALVLIFDSFINTYIIYYYKDTSKEVLFEVFMSGMKFYCGSMLIHTSMSVYTVPPNIITNTYNIYSPIG